MEIRVTRYDHISETDGLPLAVVRTEPADGGNVCGAALIVHGMCEHKGRYEAFVNFLAEQGYIVTIFDLRGHGESVREPEDLGYFYEGGYEALLADIHEMVGEAKNGPAFCDDRPQHGHIVRALLHPAAR